jgi:putative redox protein
MKFNGAGTDPTTPAVCIDGDGESGPSPMLALLMAAAGCAGADVVSILEKMRVGLEDLSIDLVGTRSDEHPKRYLAVSYRFRLSGRSLDLTKAERAVKLSLEKYCSVVHSLAPDIVVEHDIELV